MAHHPKIRHTEFRRGWIGSHRQNECRTHRDNATGRRLGLDITRQSVHRQLCGKGVIGRRGNGNLRHVRVGRLWIQERVENGELAMQKVPGEWDPADLLTKGLSQEKVERFVGITSQRFVNRRAGASLRLKDEE